MSRHVEFVVKMKVGHKKLVNGNYIIGLWASKGRSRLMYPSTKLTYM